MKVTIILISIVSAVLAKSNHKAILESILNSRNNLFININTEIQHSINKLFSMLKLSNVLNNPEMRPILAIYYDLINLSENNFEIYNQMKKIAEVKEGNKVSDKINLNEILSESQAEMFYSDDKNTTKQTSHIHIVTKPTVNSVQDSRNTEEIDQFVDDFIDKINTLSETDFLDDDHQDNGTNFLVDAQNDNDTLEIWDPDESIELANASRRIYGGRQTTVKKYPFIASVWSQDSFICGGAVISKDLIITAASCLQVAYNNRFFRENPRLTGVRVGSDYTNRKGEYVPVSELFFHPAYEPKTLNNNLVLLRLFRQLRFRPTTIRIRRIALDNVAGVLPNDIPGIYTLGWGATARTNIPGMFQHLKVNRLDVYNLYDCMDIYSRKFVTKKNFCAGFLSVGGGACNRDAGGPGVAGNKLIGIISFGSPTCGKADKPTVFTRVGYYVDWINKVKAIVDSSPFRPLLTTVAVMWHEDFEFLKVKRPKSMDKDIILPRTTWEKVQPYSLEPVNTTPIARYQKMDYKKNHQIQPIFNIPRMGTDKTTKKRPILPLEVIYSVADELPGYNDNVTNSKEVNLTYDDVNVMYSESADVQRPPVT